MEKAMKKIGVLLAGCGVYDGSEIQESVSALIALDELGVEAVCLAPDADQHHVVDHTSGGDMEPIRNIKVEAARIARGAVTPLSEVNIDDLDGLVIPGGFGVAKNLCSWAFDGPEATVREDVKSFLQAFVSAGKPIAALCIAPVLLTKALEGTGRSLTLTLGTTEGDSPYDVADFHDGIASLGAVPKECGLGDVVVDPKNRIVSSPCYMMEATPAQILEGARKACEAMVALT
jgi:enhancing lycopene biosynthesis protein 2